MASESITEPPEATTMEDMELENPQPGPENTSEDSTAKREREDDEAAENSGALKKQKLAEKEKSVEEARMEKLEEEKENGGGGEENKSEDPVILGPKKFGSSVEMFDYFYKFLHHWPTNINVNKYEYLVLQDLIKKGHPEPDKKIGSGINTFEIRYHPEWKSRCFFVIRVDESVEDFSFRKCVDHILPLPENMKIKSDVNKALSGVGKKGGGGGRGGGRGRGRGRGKGGKPRR